MNWYKAGHVTAAILLVFAISGRNLEQTERDKRIVNGKVVMKGTWPFLVSLHYLKPFRFTANTQMKHICGGTLIDKQWVLTAAHCIGFQRGLEDPANWDIVLGEYNQYLKESGEQKLKAEAFYSNPGFDPIENKNFENDIGLIKLEKPANLSRYVSLLHVEKLLDVPFYTRCEVAGWGQMSSEPYGWGMFIPLWTTVHILNRKKCARMYSGMASDIHVSESVFCAGRDWDQQTPEERADSTVEDACQGDSGGPMLCYIDGEMKLTGIVSVGIGCGRGIYPGVYTSVSFYYDWIMETMKNNSQSNATLKNNSQSNAIMENNNQSNANATI